jgi:predicted nucleic acid-binding protein
MTTAVDANIFLDLLTGPHLQAISADTALISAKRSGALCVSIICYAEISRNFRSMDETDEFFDLLSCRVDALERDVAFLAGQHYDRYKQRGGVRNRILADFLIGAHAQVKANRILTRDAQFFGPNFPRLKAVRPEDII